MIVAILIAIIVGIPLGILSALRPYSKADYGMTTFTLALSSVPTFVLGLGAHLHLRGLARSPAERRHADARASPARSSTSATHLLLPALVLGLASAAPLLRYTRASMLEALNGEYVVAAKAKGLTPNTVVVRHAFRNSLIPIITVIGLLLPELVAGAVITEQIFAWPGMGQLAVRAGQRSRSGAHDGRRAHHRNGRAGHQHPRRRHLRPRRSQGPPWQRTADAPAIPAGRRRAHSLGRAALRRFVRHRLAVVGIVMLSIIVLLAVFADLVSSKPFFTDVHGREPAAQRAAPAGHGPVRAGRLGPARLRRADVAGGRPGGRRDLRRHRDGAGRDRRAPRRPDRFPDHARRRHADEHPDAAARDRVRGRGRAEPVQRPRGHRPTRLARRVPPRPRPDARVCASRNTSRPPGSSA